MNHSVSKFDTFLNELIVDGLVDEAPGGRDAALPTIVPKEAGCGHCLVEVGILADDQSRFPSQFQSN
jgi:hypothetical protein